VGSFTLTHPLNLLGLNIFLFQYQYTLAAYVFVSSVFGENIPTAEF
jgi:hypothetical protein